MNGPVDIEPVGQYDRAGRLTIREIAMSFEISELMIQLDEVERAESPSCKVGSTKPPAPTCAPGSTKPPAPASPPVCVPGSTKEQPLIECIKGGSTKSLQESTIDASADLDAVRAQLRDRMATV
jgi:hypothetical protein